MTHGFALFFLFFFQQKAIATPSFASTVSIYFTAPPDKTAAGTDSRGKNRSRQRRCSGAFHGPDRMTRDRN
jgi:hypothetical protein